VKGFLRRGRKSTEKAEASEPIQKPMQANDDVTTEFSDDELQEFLEADNLDVNADPAFKERLRRKLWEMVRKRMGQDPGSDGI
jgi:hypothetical protein